MNLPLILSKDVRSTGPCADLAPATRAHRRAVSREVVLRPAPKTVHSVAMLRKHYWEVVDRETAERYWAIRP